MRTILFLMLALTGNHALAQCNCGSAPVMVSSDVATPVLLLPKGTINLETGFEYRHYIPETHNTSQDGHDHLHAGEQEDEELQHSTIGNLSLRYGLAPWVNVGITLPVVGLHSTGPSAWGMGDMTLTGNFRVLDWRSFGMSLQAGMEMPTGKHVEGLRNGGMAIGSGSWDGFLGASGAFVSGKNFLRANGFFKRGTAGFEDIRFGTFASQGMIYGRNLTQPFVSCNPDSTVSNGVSLSVFGGMQHEKLAASRLKDILVENTGSQSVFGQAGVVMSWGRWTMPVTVFVPVWQAWYGEQVRQGLRIRASAILSF